MKYNLGTFRLYNEKRRKNKKQKTKNKNKKQETRNKKQKTKNKKQKTKNKKQKTKKTKTKNKKTKKQKRDLCWPGIEPGSTDWKAGMLTTLPSMQTDYLVLFIQIQISA